MIRQLINGELLSDSVGLGDDLRDLVVAESDGDVLVNIASVNNVMSGRRYGNPNFLSGFRQLGLQAHFAQVLGDVIRRFGDPDVAVDFRNVDDFLPEGQFGVFEDGAVRLLDFDGFDGVFLFAVLAEHADDCVQDDFRFG